MGPLFICVFFLFLFFYSIFYLSRKNYSAMKKTQKKIIIKKEDDNLVWEVGIYYMYLLAAYLLPDDLIYQRGGHCHLETTEIIYEFDLDLDSFGGDIIIDYLEKEVIKYLNYDCNVLYTSDYPEMSADCDLIKKLFMKILQTCRSNFDTKEIIEIKVSQFDFIKKVEGEFKDVIIRISPQELNEKEKIAILVRSNGLIEISDKLKG